MKIEELNKKTPKGKLDEKANKKTQLKKPAAKPDTVITTYSGEEYTHRVIWRCVEKQLYVARSIPVGSWYYHLTAMVLGYFVFEAYLNYLGETLDKDTWANEREFFSKEPYRGTEGKLKKVLELYGLSYPNKNKRPFASVVLLGALRDEVVHATPHRTGFTVSHSVRAESPRAKRWLENQVNKTRAERTIADLDEFLEEIHALLVAKAEKNVLTPFALKGSTVIGVGSTII